MKHIQTLLPVLLFTCFLSTCAPPPEPQAEGGAVGILTRAIKAHGMEGFDVMRASFTFRKREYSIERADGSFRYTRAFTDSLGNQVVDVLGNQGLRRIRNDSVIILSPKDSAAYAASVNSVRYFFLLPYGLSDPAVNTELLAPSSIRGKFYDRVQVTFDANGGGEDHDDVYQYFFDQETGELDFLAYTFEAENGGIRFREATNKRRVNGALIQDYVNYGLDGQDRALDGIEQRYAEGILPELSRITNTHVAIDP